MTTEESRDGQMYMKLLVWFWTIVVVVGGLCLLLHSSDSPVPNSGESSPVRAH